MLTLSNALSAWNTTAFAATLKDELQRLPAGSLPLGRVGPNGGVVDDSRIVVTVIDSRRVGGYVLARVGVFFSEVVGGCSCGEDPMALDAYTEMEIHIEAATGVARFAATIAGMPGDE